MIASITDKTAQSICGGYYGILPDGSSAFGRTPISFNEAAGRLPNGYSANGRSSLFVPLRPSR